MNTEKEMEKDEEASNFSPSPSAFNWIALIVPFICTVSALFFAATVATERNMTGAVSPLLPGLIASFVLMAIGVIVGFTAVLIVASRHGTHGLMWVLALTLNIINLAVCVML